MDKIDRYIKEMLDKELQEPKRYKNIVQKALKSPQARIRIYKYKILRVLSVTCTLIVVIGGTVFAGVIAYEKVWKEPREYTYQELQETLANIEVPVDRRGELITEDEARTKAYEILENLGYGKQEIVQVELKDDVNKTNGEYYSMKTDIDEEKGYDISISARTGELNSFKDKGVSVNKDISVDDVESELAKEYADNIFNELNYSNGNYEFMSCDEMDYMLNNELVEMWEAKYGKMYGDVCNPYEFVDVSFFVSEGELKVRAINNVREGRFDENPIEVTEEHAIKVARDKELEFTTNDIKEVSVELGIRKANEYIYQLENNIHIDNSKIEDNILYMMNHEKIRNVWIVKIRHFENTANTLENVNKEYYIDATTSEILGGREIM